MVSIYLLSTYLGSHTSHVCMRSFSNNNIDPNYWFHLLVGNIVHCFHGQLEQHTGGGQQVAGPPAPPLICQWQHSDQLSFWHSTQDYRAEQSSLSALPQHIQTSTPSCWKVTSQDISYKIQGTSYKLQVTSYKFSQDMADTKYQPQLHDYKVAEIKIYIYNVHYNWPTTRSMSPPLQLVLSCWSTHDIYKIQFNRNRHFISPAFSPKTRWWPDKISCVEVPCGGWRVYRSGAPCDS